MSTQNDLDAVEKLEPSAVWRFFADIAATPRPSKREGQIRDHIKATAKKLGLSIKEDTTGNVVIEVPASPGCENAPITVLQGHLDMVCEKNAGTEHDFDRDPIRLIIDKDASGHPIVRADGTTLGADNGIGVSMALAVAASPDVVHGPLELLFTLDEEEGMTGAGALMSDFFKGRRLLNLDSEEDDILYIGCAGGCDANLSWQFDRKPIDGEMETCRVTVKGLRGGHSGGDIHEGRASANKLLVRSLRRAEHHDLRLIGIYGGSVRNAIAREAEAVVCGTAGLRKTLDIAADSVTAEAKAESYEANVIIKVEYVTTDNASVAISAANTKRLLAALAAIPHGVLGMHPKVEGLVQTSNNLATIVTQPNHNDTGMHVTVGMLTRSSTESRVDEVLAQIVAIGQLAGADAKTENRYPGWEPDVESSLLATCRRCYEDMFKESPHVTAIHAGLECGVIGQRVGGMDMISFGPRIEGAHSPDERVWVDSVRKSWEYLKAVLTALSRG